MTITDAPHEMTRHRALCEAVAAVHARGGEVVIRARGRSMRPMIRDGEAVRVIALAGRAPVPGEIVLARTGQGAVLHRVIAVDGAGGQVRLKGDGEPGADALLPLDAVVGLADAVWRRERWIRLDTPWRSFLARFISLRLAPHPPLRRLARRLVPSSFL